jgi:undecaprenyl-diphosphatase
VDPDIWLLQRLNGLAGRAAPLDTLAAGVARFTSVAEVALVLLLPLAAGWRGLVALWRAALALQVATVAVRALRGAVPRPRPYIAGTAVQLVQRRPGPSFPSRHVASAFALALPAARAHPWLGRAMLLLALLLGLSRVYSGLHYPSDVLAGAAIGVASARLVERF